MRLKNKYTGQIISATYYYWKTKILKTHTETNWIIETKPELVDVYKINHDNGKLKFVETIDKRLSERYFKKDSITAPDEYTLKQTDLSRFDEFYRLKNQSELSFFKRIKAKVEQIIKPNQKPNKIPFSRFERITIIIGISAIAIAIIIPVILFIIEKKYF